MRTEERLDQRRRPTAPVEAIAEAEEEAIRRQRPPSSEVLTQQYEGRRRRRLLAASAAAKAGGAASLVAVLLGAQVVGLSAEATGPVIVKTSPAEVVSVTPR